MTVDSPELPGEPPGVEPDPGGRSAPGELRQRQGRFLAGTDGEQRVVRVLVDMVDTGWTVLPDRR